MRIISFSFDETYCYLKNNGKSAGQYDIFPEFLKYAREKLVVVITKFFDAILARREVPDDWSLSAHCPIFKKVDINDMNNYIGKYLANCRCKLFYPSSSGENAKRPRKQTSIRNRASRFKGIEWGALITLLSFIR